MALDHRLGRHRLAPGELLEVLAEGAAIGDRHDPMLWRRQAAGLWPEGTQVGDQGLRGDHRRIIVDEQRAIARHRLADTGDGGRGER